MMKSIYLRKSQNIVSVVEQFGVSVHVDIVMVIGKLKRKDLVNTLTSISLDKYNNNTEDFDNCV